MTDVRPQPDQIALMKQKSQALMAQAAQILQGVVASPRLQEQGRTEEPVLQNQIVVSAEERQAIQKFLSGLP